MHTRDDLKKFAQTLIQDSCYLLIRLDTVLPVKNAKAHAAGSGEMFFIATVEADESTPNNNERLDQIALVNFSKSCTYSSVGSSRQIKRRNSLRFSSSKVLLPLYTITKQRIYSFL